MTATLCVKPFFIQYKKIFCLLYC